MGACIVFVMVVVDTGCSVVDTSVAVDVVASGVAGVAGVGVDVTRGVNVGEVNSYMSTTSTTRATPQSSGYQHGNRHHNQHYNNSG